MFRTAATGIIAVMADIVTIGNRAISELPYETGYCGLPSVFICRDSVAPANGCASPEPAAIALYNVTPDSFFNRFPSLAKRPTFATTEAAVTIANLISFRFKGNPACRTALSNSFSTKRDGALLSTESLAFCIKDNSALRTRAANLIFARGVVAILATHLSWSMSEGKKVFTALLADSRRVTFTHVRNLLFNRQGFGPRSGLFIPAPGLSYYTTYEP
jgi:hypothetical protein